MKKGVFLSSEKMCKDKIVLLLEKIEGYFLSSSSSKSEEDERKNLLFEEVESLLRLLECKKNYILIKSFSPQFNDLLAKCPTKEKNSFYIFFYKIPFILSKENFLKKVNHNLSFSKKIEESEKCILTTYLYEWKNLFTLRRDYSHRFIEDKLLTEFKRNNFRFDFIGREIFCDIPSNEDVPHLSSKTFISICKFLFRWFSRNHESLLFLNDFLKDKPLLRKECLTQDFCSFSKYLIDFSSFSDEEIFSIEENSKIAITLDPKDESNVYPFRWSESIQKLVSLSLYLSHFDGNFIYCKYIFTSFRWKRVSSFIFAAFPSFKREWEKEMENEVKVIDSTLTFLEEGYSFQFLKIKKEVISLKLNVEEENILIERVFSFFEMLKRKRKESIPLPLLILEECVKNETLRRVRLKIY